MRLICDWCVTEGKRLPIDEKDPFDDLTEIRAICADHRELVESKISALGDERDKLQTELDEALAVRNDWCLLDEVIRPVDHDGRPVRTLADLDRRHKPTRPGARTRWERAARDVAVRRRRDNRLFQSLRNLGSLITDEHWASLPRDEQISNMLARVPPILNDDAALALATFITVLSLPRARVPHQVRRALQQAQKELRTRLRDEMMMLVRGQEGAPLKLSPDEKSRVLDGYSRLRDRLKKMEGAYEEDELVEALQDVFPESIRPHDEAARALVELSEQHRKPVRLMARRACVLAWGESRLSDSEVQKLVHRGRRLG